MKLLPHKDWWFNMPYGKGIEGMIRQHVPSHMGQGFIFYWYFLLAQAGRPWLWALGVCIFWEALQRERWHLEGPFRDGQRTNAMRLEEQVWDVILGAAGIGLAVAIRAII